MKSGMRSHYPVFLLILALLLCIPAGLAFADVTDVNKELKEKQKPKILETEKKNDPQSFLLEKDKVADEKKRLELEEKRFHLFVDKANTYLISKGYQTENVPFKMKFKNIMKFKFKNKAYLNQKRLPKEESDYLFKTYVDTCKQTRTRIINLPEGLKKCDDCPELQE